ncbi:ChaN family lipoprotein [Desulfopila inferna]|uniref:ChaN family lipoprotein n=1 Tax=Desulfopila inferna TaxID=468528 RepID=UPI0019623116|nr:ChaN family lipoprotein [Desulfopila inferna]MBM9604614.1 ChaN family lipoprotein [Desulfopila inferna]
MNFIRIVVHALLILLVSFLHGAVMANETSPIPRYELAVSFNIARNLLYGTAHITIPPEEGLTVFLDGIDTTAIQVEIQVEKRAATPGSISVKELSQITIPPDKDQQELYISYEKEVVQEGENSIVAEGISLLHDWYPFPSRDVLFSLSAEVPQGFTAFAESDRLPNAADQTARFAFSNPLRSLHFIAAPFIIDSLAVREGLQVYTYFLPQDRELAPEYLEAARQYINRYEELVGPYPYNHFAIVENMHPTGYGMPTFTLLGKSVIRLPFIKYTSLGHEILHSWFGNSIEIDTGTGNWGEGLTTYLADWLYREKKTEGAISRKENFLKYNSYVKEESAIPLRAFTSASHNQPMAESVRASGYIRGAMVFHELRKYLGDEDFFLGIKLFYSRYKGKPAGWSDIQAVFETVSGFTLESFFEQRLNRAYIPDLEVENISVDATAEGTALSFSLLQKTEAPFEFSIAIDVITSAGRQTFTRRISLATEEIRLRLSSSPFEVIIDPRYDLLRRLDESERVAILSNFLGPRKAIVVVSGDENMRFSAFIDFFAEQNWEVRHADKLSSAELSDSNLILPGKENPIALSLFGPLNHAPTGLTLENRIHPLNKSKSILLLSSGNAEQLQKALAKLPHYGKYSYLQFRNGLITDKRFSPGTMGLQVPIAAQPVAVPADRTLSLEEVIKAMQNSRVIYIGETHTAMADHQLQHLIIEGLYRNNPDIAIGLEMFPQSSQKALDQYVSTDSTMSEQDFLKRSGYFRVWKFDYRYYKPIIDFAKKQAIPLLGLNIDTSIVSSIFKEGSVQSLSEEEKALLPEERDLSLPGYYQRLQSIHGLHMTGGHGQGGLSGFIQAQAVWDEGMAENIAVYLRNNPEKQLIVLAGTQHARKDNGIPPRVKRRLDSIEQSVLVTESSASIDTPLVADFYFFMPEISLPPAGKIGISLEEKEQNGDTFLEITALDSKSKAQDSGLLKGDRLIAVNSYPVETMEDVRIAMLGLKPGDSTAISIRRVEQSEQDIHEFEVELYRPDMK